MVANYCKVPSNAADVKERDFHDRLSTADNSLVLFNGDTRDILYNLHFLHSPHPENILLQPVQDLHTTIPAFKLFLIMIHTLDIGR